MKSLALSTTWRSVRAYTSVALVTVILGVTAGLTLTLGILSPWVTLSSTTFRALVLVSLGAILIFLLAERAVVQRAVALAELGAVRGAFHQADEVHLAAARVVMESTPAAPEDQVICVATLPGHSARKMSPKTPAPGLDLFRQQLVGRATTVPGWRVRHLLNFNTLEELDAWLALEAHLAEAPRYEARAYTTATSLPILAPLIVANEHVLLANEDPQHARLRTAVHLQGRRVAIWATAYFDDLWDGAPFRLRSQRGRQVSEIETLRRELGPSEPTAT
jgi:hypothetical protein